MNKEIYSALVDAAWAILKKEKRPPSRYDMVVIMVKRFGPVTAEHLALIDKMLADKLIIE